MTHPDTAPPTTDNRPVEPAPVAVDQTPPPMIEPPTTAVAPAIHVEADVLDTALEPAPPTLVVPDSADASPPPAAPPDAGLAQLTVAVERISSQLAESQRLLARQTDIAASLHAENQKLKAGELRKAQSALVLSVLRVLDDVTQLVAAAQDGVAASDLSIIGDALGDALARNGIDAAVVEPGEVFESRRHKVAAVEATTDPEANRTVARVVRPGFVWPDGDVIRVSDVTVFRYTAPAAEREAPESTTPPAEL